MELTALVQSRTKQNDNAVLGCGVKGYSRAVALSNKNQHLDAVNECLPLLSHPSTSSYAPLHCLLGRCYKALGNHRKSSYHDIKAVELDEWIWESRKRNEENYRRGGKENEGNKEEMIQEVKLSPCGLKLFHGLPRSTNMSSPYTPSPSLPTSPPLTSTQMSHLPPSQMSNLPPTPGLTTPGLTPIQPQGLTFASTNNSNFSERSNIDNTRGLTFASTNNSNFSERSNIDNTRGRLSFGGMGDTGGTLGSLGNPVGTPKGFGSVMKVPTTSKKSETQGGGGDGLGYKLPPSTGSAVLPSDQPGRRTNDYTYHDNTYANEATTSDGVEALRKLVGIMERAWGAVGNYEAGRAMKCLEELPRNHKESADVYHLTGLCYFETAQYTLARKSLESMHLASPGRLSGLEILSTVYWHLKDEVALSYLSRKVVSMDKTSPVTWCVVGNCYSLLKEHEMALRFFQRALEIDPSFAYASTLSGHELVANEDFDKAIKCFRDAVRMNVRHYNAWYGLGSIYYRQEKFALATEHFKRAVSINSGSCILYCHLGMSLAAQGRSDEALRCLSSSERLEPGNPQARFQRANVLMGAERYEEAYKELSGVVKAAPREASVWFLIGKVAKKLGRTDEALKAFTKALDLDPKDGNMIKARIDRLDEDEDEEAGQGF
ncbi:hypothetical protein TrCOL_g9067 [Triparma columacea]|uniref:Uncharacterized protein n=1 Tax=Triparma columacea TaxID=722753 RepID=A0A9W7LDC3_9STRA|nr:hypothetical protein TrCOL_g9067 [Triparma columacea]